MPLDRTACGEPESGSCPDLQTSHQSAKRRTRRAQTRNCGCRSDGANWRSEGQGDNNTGNRLLLFVDPLQTGVVPNDFGVFPQATIERIKRSVRLVSAELLQTHFFR